VCCLRLATTKTRGKDLYRGTNGVVVVFVCDNAPRQLRVRVALTTPASRLPTVSPPRLPGAQIRAAIVRRVVLTGN